jgi:hypothetical protein
MKRIKRTVVPLTLAGLLGTSGLLLPETVLAATKMAPGQFKDVSSSHWANQYILKMGLRNVVAGYENGTFKPDESVTQLQALVMAIRNMGLAQEAEKYKNVSVPYNVPDWAKGSVALAISKGLIKTSEQRFSPDMPASRAWVAQLMVRMIGKEADAETAPASLFTDGSAIPDWAKNYVNAAVQYELISGYKDGAGTSFKPNQAVTRAEMVTMLSKGEKFLNIESDNTHLGFLQDITGSTLTLTDETGKEQSRYTITSQTKFYEGNKAVTSAALQQDSQLLVITANGQAQYVEVVNFKEKVKREKASIEKTFEEANTVVLRMADGSLKTYTLTSDAAVGQGTDKLKLSEFVKGDQVEFAVNADGKITELLRTSVSKDKALEGSVYDIDKDNKLLTIKAANGSLEAYQYNDATYIDYKGKRFPNIEDLLPGDAVKLELTEGVVSKIIVDSVKEDTVDTGTVKALSVQDKIVTLQGENGKIQAYTMAPSAVITLSGALAPTLADIKIGDKVDIKVENNMIVSLNVKGRTVENNDSSDLLHGSIFAVDTTNRILSLKGTNDELKAYEFASSVEIIVDGKSKTSLTELKKDMNVSIQLNEDNKIIYVNADNRVRAEVLRMNPDDSLMTVKLETGETKVYIIDPNVDVNIYDERGEELDDLHANDKVALEVSGNKVTEIDVERSFVYRVTEVNESSHRISLKNDRGSSDTVYIEGKVTLTVPGITYPKVTDVKKDDVVRAVYLGDDLQSVTVVPSVMGQVVSVIPEANKIIVKDMNGVNNELTTVSGTTILVGDRQYTNLSALQPGNRVQVAEASNGAKSIVVLTKVEDTFSSLDPLGDRLYTSKSSYYLPDSLFDRQKNLNSLLSSLKKGDKVNVYLLNNQVQEVEKVN